MSKKLFIMVGLLVIASMALAACQPATPETIIETVIVEVEGETVVEYVEVEVEAAVEEAAPEGECCDVYTIGIFEDPLTTNYWSYLGPNNSVWTAYILGDASASLYTFSDQRNDFVPSLAADLPPAPVQEGDFYTITVAMVQDAVWSDGVSITAHDVVGTVMTAIELKLTGNWVSIYPPDLIDHVEALDDYTVKFYFTELPGLAKWQYNAAVGPILPMHYWQPYLDEAYVFIDGVVAPEMPEDVDCEAEGLGEEAQAACDAQTVYGEAFQDARKTLQEVDATDQPAAGAYDLSKLEPGAFVSKTMNATSYFAGAQISEYDDGTWMMTTANGETLQLYGDGSGLMTLDFTAGPYSQDIIFSIYGSQDAAFLALQDGDVDYVLNPLSLARGLREQAERGEGVVSYVNADNGVFYMAFNMRKDPYGLPEFRQAVDIILDKEFVSEKILQGSVFPAYSTVPSGNAFWWNPDVETPYVGMERGDRLNLAIQVLEDAGWTWATKPEWDQEDTTAEDVVYGTGLRMPNGQLMPDTTILGPGPAYDPQRASFNQWIGEWMRELGMPVKSELTGFNTILDPVFISADFDIYILGWSLTLYPDYLCDFFHSKNGELLAGELVGYNTPGFADDAFDAACDAFFLETDIVAAQAQAYILQDRLAEGRPYIPLFYRQSIDLINVRVELPYYEVLDGISGALGFQTDAQVLTLSK
jgi:ABC-type transport system substrate-binding protein